MDNTTTSNFMSDGGTLDMAALELTAHTPRLEAASNHPSLLNAK